MYRKTILLLATFAAIQYAGAQRAREAKDSSDAKVLDGKLYERAKIDQVYSEILHPATKKIDRAKLKEKEVSMELETGNARMLVLDSEGKNLEIKTWNQSKVKISTTIMIDGNAAGSTLTDKRWMEKLNTTLAQTGSNVRLRLRSNGGSFFTFRNAAIIGTNGYLVSEEAPVTVYDAEGNAAGTTTGRSVFTVYVPEGMKLELDNRYGNMTANAKLPDVDLTTDGGTVDLGDVGNLKLRATGTNFSAGNIREAEIEMSDGRLSAGDIDKLDIDTKSATVEINSVDDAVIRSSNDQYDIEEAGDIRGRKSYGNIRITLLKKSLDLEGANADIRVRNIDPAVELVKIDNKYADIRLPMKSIKNFTVDFKGGYNTVYAPFEKKPSPPEKDSTAAATDKNAPVTVEGHKLTGYVTMLADELVLTEQSLKGFTASGGDVKGKHTKFIITCSSCTVDFK